MDTILKDSLDKLQLIPEQITKIEHDQSISSDVYLLIQKGVKYILKLSYNAVKFRREAYFLQMLQKQLPVPKLLNSLEPSEASRGVLLLEWLPGDLLDAKDLNENMAYKMGELLAKIHNIPMLEYGDIALKKRVDTPFEGIEEKLIGAIEECRPHIKAPLLQSIKSYVLSYITPSTAFDGPCVTHRDFKPGNILAQNNEIVGLIDFENTIVSFAQEDFIPMELLVWCDYPKTKKAFFNGYSQVRPPPILEECYNALIMYKALCIIGFTIKRKTHTSSHSYIFKKNMELIHRLLQR